MTARLAKMGYKKQPDNYRPVSLNSVCRKIMESIIKDTVMVHMSSNDDEL